MPFRAGRWRARWVWAADAPDGRHTVGLATSFVLDAVPRSAPARWCAVSRSVLVVNGIEVGRGPVRSNPRRQPADDSDLAPYLRPGMNVIGAVVTSYGDPTPWYLPMPPFSNDLAGGAFVFEAHLGDESYITTEDTWIACTLGGWGATKGTGVSGRGRELISAISLPADWGATVPNWPPAVVRRAHTTGEPGAGRAPTYPIGPFGLRPLTWPDTVQRSLVHDASGGRVWRAQEVVVGTIEVDVEGPAGSVVIVQAAELVDADARPAPTEHDSSVAFTLDGTRRKLESFDTYGLQGVLVDAAEGAVVHAVAVRERLHPVTGDASFTCSDPRLNTIWTVGRRSVTINSADAYTDCPTREQRAWTGDAVVHQLVDLTTNADWTLARRHPHLAAVPRPDGMLPMAVAGDAEHHDFTIIPDWALHWVHSVWNLFRYVGDRDEVASLLAVAEGVVRWFEAFCDEQGLPTDVYGWVIIDWAAIYTEGVSASLCGLWGRALLEFAEMAEWLDDSGRARHARDLHARLRNGFERLWDAGRGRYVDSFVPGAPRPMASQHGQSAAIVGGLAPEGRIERLLDVITDRSRHVHATFSHDGPATPNSELPVGGEFLRRGHPPEPWWDAENQVVVAQPFFRYVVHDALVAAGRADLIAEQCLDWTVALDRCNTSWTETWFGGTISHGWSSTPTRDLMQRVLGVTPAEPGFTAATVEPSLGLLEFARGTLPTPAGMLTIAVDRAGFDVESPVAIVTEGVRRGPGTYRVERAQ